MGIRAHSDFKFFILPYVKLQDIDQAKYSVKGLALIKGIDAILPGDGWTVFRNDDQALLQFIVSI